MYVEGHRAGLMDLKALLHPRGSVNSGLRLILHHLLLQPPPPSPRFARHFVENGTNHRHLFKVFGIRFDILVAGKVSIRCKGQPDTQAEFP